MKRQLNTCSYCQRLDHAVYHLSAGLLLTISFFNVRLGKPWEFINIGNYVRVFSDYRVADSLWPTLTLVLGTVTTEMVLGMVLALLFHREMGERLRRLLRTCLTLPLFATPVAIGFLSLTIFYEEGGPLNSFMALFGNKILAVPSLLGLAVDFSGRDLAVHAVLFSGAAGRPASACPEKSMKPPLSTTRRSGRCSGRSPSCCP